MKISFTFQGIERTQAIEDHIAKKLAKLEEFTRSEPEPKNVNVHIKRDASFKVEIIITTKNFHLDAHETGYDLYEAADGAVLKIITQVKRQRTKMIDKQRHEGADKRTIHTSPNLDESDLAFAASSDSDDEELED